MITGQQNRSAWDSEPVTECTCKKVVCWDSFCMCEFCEEDHGTINKLKEELNGPKK